MKIKSINQLKSETAVQAIDCFVGKGICAGTRRVPAVRSDIDTDFASNRRQEVKEYLECRYNMAGKQRVFSAGTFSTMKLESCNKRCMQGI